MLTVDLSRIKVTPGSLVLDIGCGSGRHTAAAMQLPLGLAVGVDTSDGDLAAARDRLEIHRGLGVLAGKSWALAGADALRIPFRDQQFDVVICSEVLEHIGEDRRAIAEAVRVLRPGGYLRVSVPRFWPEKICWWLSRDYAANDGGHVRIYRTGALVDSLTAQGLTVTGRHHAHSLHAPFWWLKCLLGPESHRRPAVRLYHRFLTWEMMKKPRAVGFLERLLNPLMGKSVVLYLKKEPEGRDAGRIRSKKKEKRNWVPSYPKS